MAKTITKHACPFCNNISEIDVSRPKNKMSIWERECLINGMCEQCFERMYNHPTREHEEEWGPIVRTCPNCDCEIYDKDVKVGHCPSCWMPCDEMNEYNVDEDSYS